MKGKVFLRLLMVGVLLGSFVLLGTPNKAFADAVGGGGTGGTPSGGGGGTGHSIGKAVGGGWFRFDWGVSGSQAPSLAPSNYYPNNPVTWNNGGIEYVGESGFPGGVIGAECASVGGYYVSSWYHFLRGTTYVGLVGVAQNSIWNDYATLYDSTKGGTAYGNPSAPIQPTSITEVKDAFDTAVGAGVVPSNVTWENVGWFCYDDSLKEKKGEVHAKSTITATTDGATYSEESDEDGFVGIKISTDSGTVDVSFGQTFTFKPGKDANGNDYDFTTDNPSKTFSDKYTYIGTKKDGSSAISVGRQWDATANSNSLTWSPSEDKNTITVTLDEGEVTEPICRSAKNYNTELNFKGTSEPEGSNPASTEACIVIERPKKPGPEEENLSPSITGRNSTDPMYIGEGSSIGWNTKVYNKVKKLKYNDNGNLTVKTRRLKRYKVISYLVNPNLQRTVNNTTESVAGNSSYSSNNLCDYIRSVLGASNVSGCGVVKGRDNDASKDRDETWDEATTDEYPYRKEQAVVVPENYGSGSSIGAKYCTTMGYKFEYWYGVNRTGGSSWTSHITWQEDPKRDSYWYIFPSACSVIAKRPSMAVWNGSVFADAGAKTSLSKRYSNSEGKTPMGTLTNGVGVEISNTYGSWDEYLVISNKDIKGMTSASALANGKANGDGKGLEVGFSKVLF